MMLDVCDEIGVDSDSNEVQAEILQHIENINAKFVNKNTEESEVDGFIEIKKKNKCVKGKVDENDESNKRTTKSVEEDAVFESHLDEDLAYLDGNSIDGFKFLKKVARDFDSEIVKKVRKEEKYNELIEFVLILLLISFGIILIGEYMFRQSSERYR